MKKIQRYHLPECENIIELPVGSSVLSVANQDNSICLFAAINPEGKTEKRCFTVAFCGDKLEFNLSENPYLGNVFDENGFSRHVFENKQRMREIKRKENPVVILPG